jgi:zinc D-Ala-D-Ala carboxypeptidase
MLLQETKFVLLSDHFTLHELVKSNTAKALGIENLPDEGQIKNLTKLVQFILEPARMALGEPIQLSSGFRSKELNYLLHGAKKSQHLSGCAADIHLRDDSYGRRLFDILSHNSHVDQLLYEHNSNGVKWIHVSYSRKPRHDIRELGVRS